MTPIRPPGRKALSHERIVETAARAIRRGGFDGVGVADIMKEAGLTHGGFYAHFPSRDALLVEALERAAADSAKNVAHAASDPRLKGASEFHKLVAAYLSEGHLKEAESGCPVAALVSEMPRQSPEVRKAAARSVRSTVAAVRAALPRDVEPGTAEVIASQMIGALQLARAFGANAEGKALLATVRRQLLSQYDTTPPH
ncbi:TetR/AcrR family transcriptional regulator [Pyxidicoccus caerfyrddinensis]|uniref:TetR/AcrR family transcriptional regulator n=1 Tax=Pyxidicoccus caerfyrddinensis TaxID=2709663 RepID=UPI0013DBE2EB|nr:TetR/AcrR family transcriptional regulator [Pyxidicoccus caerfyrddinensis]